MLQTSQSWFIHMSSIKYNSNEKMRIIPDVKSGSLIMLLLSICRTLKHINNTKYSNE